MQKSLGLSVDLGMQAENIGDTFECQQITTNIHRNLLSFSVNLPLYLGLFLASAAAICIKMKKNKRRNSKTISLYSSCGTSSQFLETIASEEADHLLVLVHGIGGSAANWKFTEDEFRQRASPSFVILTSIENAFSKTFDGIDVMGKRLKEEVLVYVRANPRLKKISFIGHSMGGLVARYAIGQMLEESVEPGADFSSACSDLKKSLQNTKDLSERCETANGTTQQGKSVTKNSNEESVSEDISNAGNPSADGEQKAHSKKESERVSDSNTGKYAGPTIAGLQPVNFITIATPHLGCCGRGHLPFLFKLGFLERVSPAIAPAITGKTGKHLFLADGQMPLLLKLATDCSEGKFISALKNFKQRIAYANTEGDQMVGWRTASIRRPNEKLPKVTVEYNPLYPHIMRVEEIPATPFPHEGFKFSFSEEGADLKRRIRYEQIEILEDTIVTSLLQMPWKRVDVNFNKAMFPWMAHNLIQVKESWIHGAGAGVIHHIIDNVQV